MASTYPPNYNYAADDDSFLHDEGDDVSYSYIEGEEGPYSAPLPNRAPSQVMGRGPPPPPAPQGYGPPPQGLGSPPPRRGPGPPPAAGPPPRGAPAPGQQGAPYRYQPEDYGPRHVPSMRGPPPPAGPVPRVGSMGPSPLLHPNYAAHNSSFPPVHGSYSRSFHHRHTSGYESEYPMIPPEAFVEPQMYDPQPMNRQSLYLAQQQELDRFQRARSMMPRRTEEEDALYVAMLCSEQEALYGTNMLEDITPEDRIFIESLIARGVPENEALRVSFERKPHAYRTKKTRNVDTDADKNALEEAIMLSLSESSARASRPDPPAYSSNRHSSRRTDSVSRSRSREDAELNEALRISERTSNPQPLFPEPVIDYTKLEDVPKPSAKADEDALQAAIRLSMIEGGAPVQYGLEDTFEYGGRAHSYAEGDDVHDHYRAREEYPEHSRREDHEDDRRYEKSYIQREIEQRKAMHASYQQHHRNHANGADVRRAIDEEHDGRHHQQRNMRDGLRRETSESSVGSDITGENEFDGDHHRKHHDHGSPRNGDQHARTSLHGDHAAVIMRAAHKNESSHVNILASHQDGKGMVRRPSLVEMHHQEMMQRENSGISDLGMGSASRRMDSGEGDPTSSFSKSGSQELDKNRTPEHPHHKYHIRGSMHSSEHLNAEDLPHHNSSANLRRLISKITMEDEDDDEDAPMPVRAAAKNQIRAFDDVDEKAR